MHPTIPELWREQVLKALTIPAWLLPYLPPPLTKRQRVELRRWQRRREWRQRRRELRLCK